MRSTDDDDISPIRRSLPPGPPSPVAPIVALWTLLAAGGFAMRINPAISQPPGVIQFVGLACANIGAVLALRLLGGKAVMARLCGGFGLVIAVCEIAYLIWLLRLPIR